MNPRDDGDGAAWRVLATDRVFRRLFGAQAVALLGAGLLTVALGLLAFDLAGGDAGVVLGIALTIKMVAYIVVTPFVAAVSHRLPRRPTLVAASVVRGGVAASLVLVTETWHVYLLIFVLQAASAVFTPTFQAAIPDIVTDEREFTRAASASRLAYDAEALLSPLLAAALLTVVSFDGLFVGTAVGFVLSAYVVARTSVPPAAVTEPAPFAQRFTLGARIFARTPELRGLSALNLGVAAVTAMVIVNTVVFVRSGLERPQSDVALLFAVYGLGSIVVALYLPRLLDRVEERTVMLTGGVAAVGALALSAVVTTVAAPAAWWPAITVWTALGASVSLVLTPSARLLRRAADPGERPAAFAAQFVASHLCFALTYPLAGAIGAAAGLDRAAVTLGVLAALAVTVATVWWPLSVGDDHRHWHRHGWRLHIHTHPQERAHTHPPRVA